MIKYNVFLNNGNEALGVTEKTITANEVLDTVDEQALAREITHENPLIPEQVAKSVLENFCKAAANLMSMGFAIQLKSGQDVAMRIYPDVHVKDGNINLKRARELDPEVAALTVENAGALVDKAGVTVRVRAESEVKFTELLKAAGAGVQRKDVVEKEMVKRKDSGGSGTGTGGSGDSGSGSSGSGSGGSGSDDDGDDVNAGFDIG